MSDGMPRDDDGLLPCAWCGGRIEQPKIGRRRAYCKRSCRELAYRDRRTQRLIAEAVDAARADDTTRSSTTTDPRRRGATTAAGTTARQQSPPGNHDQEEGLFPFPHP